MSLLETVQQYLGKNEVNQISERLGVDPQTTQTAISAALPMIVGGMARHAANPEGAAKVQEAADTHANAVDDVQETVRTAPVAGGGGLLDRIFGSHQPPVEEGVQQASGLNLGKAKHLLAMLAPLVLSAFARLRNTNQSSGNGIGTQLGQEAEAARGQMPKIGGFLGQLLGA